MKNSKLAGWLGGTLLLAAASAAAAQTTPSHWTVQPGELIYLDGVRSTLAAINQVPEAAVAQAESRIGKPGTLRVFGDSLATRVLVLTTKAHANDPATLALADRTNLSSAYVWEPATLLDVAPPALAYITSHYPAYWLDGKVQKLTRKSTGEVKYQVWLAGNWGWRYLCFTPDGAFVDDTTY